MTRIKEQIIEMLQDIPDDKVIHILEMTKGLKALYSEAKESNTLKSTPSAMGILKEYANPDLIPMEKEAWGEAVKDKVKSSILLLGK